MPSSAVRTFTDPDDYATAIRASTVQLTVVRRGNFNAKLTRIDLHHLWMQRFSDSLPRIAHAAYVTGRAIVIFRTRPGPDLRWGGAEMLPSNIVRHTEGESTFQRSSGVSSFGAMSLPIEHMVAVGETLVGRDLTPPRDPLVVTPSAFAITKLQRLHAAAADLAETAPEIIVNPDAAGGLEQAIVEALAECLDHHEDRGPSLAQGQHAIVMRRFWR